MFASLKLKSAKVSPKGNTELCGKLLFRGWYVGLHYKARGYIFIIINNSNFGKRLLLTYFLPKSSS